MIQTSTRELLLLHAYGETNPEQREYLAGLLAESETLQNELLEIMDAKRQLSQQLKSPSATSVRIIMEHSHKTEYLQEI